MIKRKLSEFIKIYIDLLEMNIDSELMKKEKNHIKKNKPFKLINTYS